MKTEIEIKDEYASPYDGATAFCMSWSNTLNYWVVITPEFRDWDASFTLRDFNKFHNMDNKYRLVWGTRWKRWVAIKEGDRDWNHAVEVEAFINLGHDACLGYYIVSRRIGA